MYRITLKLPEGKIDQNVGLANHSIGHAKGSAGRFLVSSSARLLPRDFKKNEFNFEEFIHIFARVSVHRFRLIHKHCTVCTKKNDHKSCICNFLLS